MTRYRSTSTGYLGQNRLRQKGLPSAREVKRNLACGCHYPNRNRPVSSIKGYLCMQKLLFLMTVALAAGKFDIKRAVVVWATCIIHWPFARTIDMPLALAKECQHTRIISWKGDLTFCITVVCWTIGERRLNLLSRVLPWRQRGNAARLLPWLRLPALLRAHRSL